MWTTLWGVHVGEMENWVYNAVAPKVLSATHSLQQPHQPDIAFWKVKKDSEYGNMWYIHQEFHMAHQVTVWLLKH